MFTAWMAAIFGVVGKGITNVEPERAIVPENAPDLMEDLHQPRHICCWRLFQADLQRFVGMGVRQGKCVVDSTSILGTRYACLHETIGQGT